MHLCSISSCGFFGSERFLKYDGALTTAVRMSGPCRSSESLTAKQELMSLQFLMFQFRKNMPPDVQLLLKEACLSGKVLVILPSVAK